MWHQGLLLFTHMVTKFPSNKRPCVCCLCHQGPCSQALTLMKAPPTTTHSALRAGQTIREVDTGHRARQKQVPLLPLEIEAPWPNRMNFYSLWYGKNVLFRDECHSSIFASQVLTCPESVPFTWSARRNLILFPPMQFSFLVLDLFTF